MAIIATISSVIGIENQIAFPPKICGNNIIKLPLKTSPLKIEIIKAALGRMIA